jgi:hypothetical protein
MSVAITTQRKRKPVSVAHTAFEKEFAFESLKSDRLRVTILIGAVVSSLLILLVLTTFFFDEFQATFHGNFKGFLMAVVVVFGVNLSYLDDRNKAVPMGQVEVRGREQTIQIYQVA